MSQMESAPFPFCNLKLCGSNSARSLLCNRYLITDVIQELNKVVAEV